ncbi:MAG: SPOR domain-containing protein [Porphyromonadaceae bacterium]|nr:SPOR domain-containing protein [Porphyromonadaceae bacterium]
MSTRLAKHIEALLVQHTCVVVPGIGGFVLETLPARVDEAAHLAYPPRAELRFNEALSHYDGLLEGRYASVYGISMRRARIMLEEDARSLRSELVRKREYHLSSLGVLSLSEEGRLSFAPDTAASLCPTSYGLMPIAMPEVIGQRADEQQVTSPIRSADYLQIRLPKRVLGWSASAVAILLAFAPWGELTEPRETFTASFVPSELSVRQVWGAEALEAVEDEASEQLMGNESPWIEAEVGRYYVIIASEHSEELALAHYERAGEQRLVHLQILRGNKMHRVSAGDFASNIEAYTYLKQISHLHPEAWVYTPRR